MEKVKINLENSEIRVNFNEKIYGKMFIEKAAEDFSLVCEVKKSEDGLLLKTKDKEDLEILGYEFYNYVLGLVRNQ